MARQPRQLAGIGAADLPNQAAVDAYKGPPREIIVGAETLHLQDGTTPGGKKLLTSGASGDASNLGVALPGVSAPAKLSLAIGAVVRFEWFGGKADSNPASAATNSAALNAALAYMDSFPYGAELIFPTGYIYLSQRHVLKISRGKHAAYRGRGRLATKFVYTGTEVGPFITVGDDLPDHDSANAVLEGISIYAPAQPAANAVGAVALAIKKRSGIIVRDVALDGYDTGTTVVESYGPKFYDVIWSNMLGSALRTEADGSVNTLLMEGCGAFNCGHTRQLPALDFVGGVEGINANALSLINTGVENSYKGARFTNVYGASLLGVYIELNQQGNLEFAGTCSAFDIRSSWFGEQTATLTFANLKNSIVQSTVFYNTQINFDTSATDNDFGAIILRGTSAIVGGPAWNTPTLAGGWANIGGSYDVAGYRRHADGSVELKGSLVGTNGAGPYTIFNLPAGYRPAKLRQFSVAGLANAGSTPARVEVNANGNISVYPVAGGYISLDGIRFTIW